jgi:hypothetical protein
LKKTDGRVAEIKKFAAENGLLDNLNSKLRILVNREKDGCEVNLNQDFTPYSLYFEEIKEG